MSTEPRFTVTVQWLKQHATARGGYTKAQLALIGVAWPPTPGWQQTVDGAEIAASDAARFEALAAASKGPAR